MLRPFHAAVLLGIAACGSTGEIADPQAGSAVGPYVEPKHASPDAGAAPPTFAVDVEPIVQSKCQNCHHDGGIAPFPLVTYEDVTSHGYNAQRRVNAREMPPWGAFDTDDCKLQHKLQDDLRLTDGEISTISRWVDAGMPMGDATKRPPPRTSFPALGLDGASSFKLPKPYAVEPGADDIRCFPIDPGLTEDTWVTATNVRPGDPRVVHHVIVYLDKSKKGPSKVDASGTSYPCFGGPGLGEGAGSSLLLAWAPGVPPTGLGQTEAAIKIPKGSGLVMQVHYHPTNVPVTDQSSFEILSLPPGKPPAHVAQVQLAGNARDAAGSNTQGLVKLLPGPDDPPEGPAFFIPSNAAAHTEKMDISAPASLTSLSALGIKAHFALVGSHMHWAGTNLQMKIERAAPSAEQPKNECLIATPKYDFNWQRGYAYDEPYDKLPTIAAGDTIHLECTYNNSISNKNVARAMLEERAKQPFDLHLGETTHDEMCLGALVIVRDFIPGYD